MRDKYWFRKRRGLFSKDLGYGWVPISWQGYVMTVIFLLILISSSFYFNLYKGGIDSGIKFIILLVVSIIIFALIAKSKTKK